MLPVLAPLGVVILPLCLMMAVLHGIRYQQRRKKRRNPVKDHFLRTPGESLRHRIDDMTDDMMSYLPMMPLMPLFFYAVHVSFSYFGGAEESALRTALSIGLGFSFLLHPAVKMSKLFKTRTRLRLAYESELAVGQELDQLMLHGYQVFHDFPADGFNIDHIVVGRSGVFAVETKGRSKPTTGNGCSDAKVVYDGDCLRFPGWTESKPILQSKRQADWLRKWLSRATAESVNVFPVLAIPGWCVERVRPNGIAVLNPKNFLFYAKHIRGEPLSEKVVKRVSHQLEQRCRDVAPKAYT